MLFIVQLASNVAKASEKNLMNPIAISTTLGQGVFRCPDDEGNAYMEQSKCIAQVFQVIMSILHPEPTATVQFKSKAEKNERCGTIVKYFPLF